MCKVLTEKEKSTLKKGQQLLEKITGKKVILESKKDCNCCKDKKSLKEGIQDEMVSQNVLAIRERDREMVTLQNLLVKNFKHPFAFNIGMPEVNFCVKEKHKEEAKKLLTSYGFTYEQTKAFTPGEIWKNPDFKQTVVLEVISEKEKFTGKYFPGAIFNMNIQENQHSDFEPRSENYMFWQNLNTIKHGIDHLLQMNVNEIDSVLKEHAWAVDLIAKSSNDIEQVYHFLNQLNEIGNKESLIVGLNENVSRDPNEKYLLYRKPSNSPSSMDRILYLFASGNTLEQLFNNWILEMRRGGFGYEGESLKREQEKFKQLGDKYWSQPASFYSLKINKQHDMYKDTDPNLIEPITEGLGTKIAGAALGASLAFSNPTQAVKKLEKIENVSPQQKSGIEILNHITQNLSQAIKTRDHQLQIGNAQDKVVYRVTLSKNKDRISIHEYKSFKHTIVDIIKRSEGVVEVFCNDDFISLDSTEAGNIFNEISEKIQQQPLNESVRIGQMVRCTECGHKWKVSAGDPEPLLCHTCGFENHT